MFRKATAPLAALIIVSIVTLTGYGLANAQATENCATTTINIGAGSNPPNHIPITTCQGN